MSELSRADTIRALADVPLFTGLTKRQMSALAKLVDHASFDAGSVLVSEAKTGTRLIIIRSGTAAVIKRTDQSGDPERPTELDGRRLATVGPGDFVGELSLIDGWPTSASVVAETPIDALLLYRTRFNTLLRSTPQLYPRLLVGMATQIRASNRHDALIG